MTERRSAAAPAARSLVVLAIVTPSTNTPQERAAAYGEAVNAQELIDRARKNSAEFKDGRSRFKEWGRDWRGQHRQARRQLHRTMRGQPWGFAPAVAPPAGYAAWMLAGFMVSVLTLVSAAL